MKPNHTVAFVAATLAALALGACSKVGTKSEPSRVSMAASPSAQLIGTTPGPASAKEPPGVTPVATDTSDESKAAQQTGPKEGDNNSHLTNNRGQKSAGGKESS
ncbi:MAG TPA: hypothetical protein VLL50_11705 [Usitatibacter sp.]|nr:hypothetical protein [Usitatibacter sp.]